MRNRICLAAAMLLVLAGPPAPAQVRPGSVMDRKVTVTFNQAPLESVLRTLRKQYGVRISYSNTALNLRQPVTLNVQNQPLRTVLNELLRDKNIGYELVGDQVVLHPAPNKPAPAARPAGATGSTTTTVSKSAGAAAAPETGKTGSGPAATSQAAANPETARTAAREKTADKPASGPARPAAKAKGAAPKPAPKASNKAPAKAAASKPAGSKANTPNKVAAQPAAPKTNSSVPEEKTSTAKPGQTPLPAPAAEPPADTGVTASAGKNSGAIPAAAPADSVAATAARPSPVAQDTAAAPAAAESAEATAPTRPTYTRTAQVSFLGPLGSNGLKSGQTVNAVSLNVLGGYAAGVDGVEAAGLFNVSRDTVKGMQVAGLANVVGKRLQGFQGAGLANVLGGSGEGWQAAGLFNVATRPMTGAQAAGLFNYSGWPKAGEEARSQEFLVQAGGLFNVALGEVRGVQAAGLFNVANQVRGVQLAGLVNIADSVSGVSLAPLNFVRKGYHRLELTTSESWLLQANLKLGGSPYFYTFFTGTLDPGTDRRWGVGYGVGAEFLSRQRLSLSLDAVAIQVNEEQQGLTDALNLQNQLRLLAGFSPFRKGGRVRVVAGPVVNLLVTQRYDTGRQAIGSNLSEGRNLWLDDGNATTRVLGWVGYAAGIRF